jgi:hypothetical protein
MLVIYWLGQSADSVHVIIPYKGSESLFCIVCCSNDVTKISGNGWFIFLFPFLGYLTTFSVSTQYNVGRQDDSRVLFKVLFRNFPRGTEENFKNLVSITDVIGEIRT